MKVTERRDPKTVKVSQDSIGSSGVGFVELTTSFNKQDLPIFGKGFLDIFVEKKRTQDGYDYWKECVPEKSEMK
jgi:hypothetical protein